MIMRFKLSGMGCASCVAAIEKAAAALPGVAKASINFALEQLQTEGEVSAEAVIQAVKKAGYTAELIPENLSAADKASQAALNIGGMSCAACSAAVEKALNRIKGVKKASVSMAAEKAFVFYDAKQASLKDFKKAVAAAGYKVLEAQISSQNKALELKKEKKTTLFALFFAVLLLYLAMGPMIGLPVPALLNPNSHPLAFALAQLALLLPILAAGRSFFSRGFKTLLHRAPNMDSLIALGSSAAIIYSAVSLAQIVQGQAQAAHRLYFETAGVIIALVKMGKYLEARSKGQASAAIAKLIELAPQEAIVIKEGQEILTPADRLQKGDLVLVKPGARIPADGIIEQGETSIDESMLTGESLPVDKKPGDKATAGSLNKFGAFHLKTTNVGAETTLAKLARMVEEAQLQKAPIAQLADKVSGIFVPVVLAIAALSALGWFLAGESLDFVFTVFVSVLTIACPCALGLATPAAIMVGVGRGAQMGILIKNGPALETTGKITTVLLDKTGTVTMGLPAVADIKPAANIDHLELLRLAASAELHSEHPLGKAVVEEAKRRNLALSRPSGFKAAGGMGLQAEVEGKRIIIGNALMLQQADIAGGEAQELAGSLSAEGKTPLLIAADGALLGVIAVADPIKPSSPQAIKRLAAMGLKTAMVTGDNRQTAQAIAAQAGIAEVFAETLPQDKAEKVKELQKQKELVLMAGDGINDAPALAQADAGAAIGSGADIAIESADIVLVKSDLADLVAAVQLSRAVMRNIKQNLFWAFAYNSLGIPIAAGLLHLFGGPLLNPMLAALAMAFSSVSVVGNALRLRGFKPR